MKIENLFNGKEKTTYSIAEIGINHNGDLNLAFELIKICKDNGFDAVKFQKRVPELCVPIEKRDEVRNTPWGKMTYFDYKKKIEFSKNEYDKIDQYCKSLEIEWSASAWDSESLEFLEQYKLPFIKIPSDKNSDLTFIKSLKRIKTPIILSSGGTSVESLSKIIEILKENTIALLQCTSIYPCPTEKVNLSVMDDFKKRFKVPVGFSSHHSSPILSAMACAYGAQIIEVHVTLDRALWGTDQAMSIGPRGGEVLIRSIKQFELAKGETSKVVYEEESKTLSRTVDNENLN